MSNWKEERKRNRASTAECKIREIREKLEANEELISAIETPEVMVFARNPEEDFLSKTLMTKRGFAVRYCEALHKVDVGVHACGSKKDIASLRLALSNDVARTYLRRAKYEDIVNINIKDDEALDELLVIAHGIYLILFDFKRRNQEESAKAKSKETKSEI